MWFGALSPPGPNSPTEPSHPCQPFSPLPPPALPLSPSFPPPLTVAPHSSRAGVSPIASILQLSLDIFVTLIKYFKAHLKSEIGVFFSNILLRILESSNSSGVQKLLTVHSLRVLVPSDDGGGRWWIGLSS